MAGSLTRPLLQGSGRLLPEREGDTQLLELGRQDGLLAEEGLLPGLVHQAAEPVPHQIPEPSHTFGLAFEVVGSGLFLRRKKNKITLKR